ncbi:MAG: hypothetical protein ACTS5F_00550 [Candidatus Hodgkinia cicadicola]
MPKYYDLFWNFGPEGLSEKLNMLHCAIETVCIEIQRRCFDNFAK